MRQKPAEKIKGCGEVTVKVRARQRGNMSVCLSVCDRWRGRALSGIIPSKFVRCMIVMDAKNHLMPSVQLMGYYPSLKNYFLPMCRNLRLL